MGFISLIFPLFWFYIVFKIIKTAKKNSEHISKTLGTHTVSSQSEIDEFFKKAKEMQTNMSFSTVQTNSVTKKTCKHCGKSIDHDSRFCKHCGMNTK